ncbi:ABC transporter permease [Spirulina sp. 06S082]|uniref:ABC transporter permease n=1 Tax=Spirulina sp. 06S082 TaxID=3110248 RepID=UPI002B2128F7|nr:ABC transporter permease [Spirulina sp. 06S082]MEA5471555.1 ABC transporter permease [Spirulina sp. 06S082]
METAESMRMAVDTLLSNKLRSALTMLGIVIGNASVIAMIGFGQGAQKLANDEFESLGPNVIFIVPGSQQDRETTFDLPKTLVLEDAKAIASQVPSVDLVAPQINAQMITAYKDRNARHLITGVTPEFMPVRDYEIDRGRFITERDLQRNTRVVVLGSERAERYFDARDPIGEQVRIKNIGFEVVGVMKSKGAFLGTNQDDIMFLPLTTMANQLVGKTSIYGTEISFISVSAKDKKSINAAKFQLENLLRLRHKIVGEDDFTVRTQKDILNIVGTVTGGLTTLLAGIAGISLLVGGIGVMNIMLVSVTERTQEIGLRKAMGARENDILSQFLVEATIVSAAGGIIGTIVGISGIIFVSLISPLSAVISPLAVILAVGMSGGIGLIFGVFPARRAAKLDPIVALRRL